MTVLGELAKMAAMVRDTNSNLVVDHGNDNRRDYILGVGSRTRSFPTEAELDEARARYLADNPGAPIWTSKPLVDPQTTHNRYHPTSSSPKKK